MTVTQYFGNDFFSVRKWKTKTTLGADKKWEFEIGEDLSVPSPMETSIIVESRSNVSYVAVNGKPPHP